MGLTFQFLSQSGGNLLKSPAFTLQSDHRLIPNSRAKMSREELALETQLLLQEVTQLTQHAAVESVLEDASAPPAVSEFEEAKQALLAKLRKKKEANRVQRQQLNQRRFGLDTGTSNMNALKLTPRKANAAALKLPVASMSSAPSRKKRDMLAKLRTQAIQQGSRNMAKMFGYDSYEEQVAHLNEIEKKILQSEEEQQQQEQQQAHAEEGDEADDEEEEQEAAAVEQEADGGGAMDMSADGVSPVKYDSHAADGPEDPAIIEQHQQSAPVEVGAAPASPSGDVSPLSSRLTARAKSLTIGVDDKEGESVVVKRRNRIQVHEGEEDDGNEADSEQDDQGGAEEDEDDVMDDVAQQEVDAEDPKNSEKPAAPKDKAAGFRNLLRAEALENRKRKRLVKGRGDNFVESEAEEDDDDDVLKIGGLGDFGFGVPQAKTQESKEAEEERKALQLREDDLDHIVDDLSDDEREQEQDLEEMFRREQETQDRQQVKEVMRNVKEGFGRNRRAFSGLHSGSEARGRFNLDELVAADGSKFEAARLGLLESDEELDEDDATAKKASAGADGEDEEEEEDNEEEDEEEEMERMLRQRFMDQPKIYVTSSESGSDDEDENDGDKGSKAGPDGDEVESDEERERQQMKLFSERARVNRRMQRMKDMQRQMAMENNDGEPIAKDSATAMPNLLLEEDEDSQELMKLLNRTDVEAAASSNSLSTGSSHTKARTDRPRPKLGRFSSYSITSASRASSSFSRVIGNCKLFSANSTSAAPSKGFVFTSFSSDKPEQEAGEETVALASNDAASVTRPELAKSKSWSHSAASKAGVSKRRAAPGGGPAKKKSKRGSDFFSVLSSYQCVSSTSSSNNSVPM
ncbi:hypothetical protein BBJ28_00011549 [Nothophytophthora sp. Chile5]|nr:hypothetical protein BBJ28_00011549 [Nothophytophthora sp. Chile5]